MDIPIKSSSSLNLTILFLLAGAGLLFVFFISPGSIFPLNGSYSCSGHKEPADAHEDDLDTTLRRASTENRTVIIAIVNRAYADPASSDDMNRTMLDLFINSFWLGKGTRNLIDHVLIVAMDRTAYEMCKFRRLNCYRLVTEGVDFAGEKIYMSADFIKMMWSRTTFLADVLRRGYNFIFTDTDVMWLRNPFNRLSTDETEDLQISTDMFNGDPWSASNLINTGFYFVRSNNRTVSLFATWYAMKDNSTGKKEQDVLLQLMGEGIFGKLGLRVRFLDTLYFSGFCSDSRDFNAVTTVHANCCRSITAKIFDLTAVLRDWRRYRFANWTAGSSDRNRTGPYVWSKHVACKKSWEVL